MVDSFMSVYVSGPYRDSAGPWGETQIFKIWARKMYSTGALWDLLEHGALKSRIFASRIIRPCVCISIVYNVE